MGGENTNAGPRTVKAAVRWRQTVGVGAATIGKYPISSPARYQIVSISKEGARSMRPPRLRADWGKQIIGRRRGFLMGSMVARALGVVGAVILSVAMFGSGVASADALAGQTYSDAAAKISGWNGKAVIGTVSGNQLEMGDCIVTSWQKSMFLDSLGEDSRSNEYLLHLNCNNRLASPGHPGNSVMSPEGVAAKKDQQFVRRRAPQRGGCEVLSGQEDSRTQ
jgi:hypothetical protein